MFVPVVVTIIFCLLQGSGFSDTPQSEQWVNGKVVGVTDGDTMTLLDSSNVQHKVRFYGIDAPEKKQDFGTQSKKCLSDMIFGKDVRILVVETDRYKREIGRVYVGDTYVNMEMVKKGMAWHYVAYAKKDDVLRDAEKEAREKKLGLWEMDNPIAPWDFRKKK